MEDISIPFITLPNWLKAAQRCGFNIEPILQRHGVQVDLLNLENATARVSDLTRIMEECIGRAEGVHFPFVLGETFAFEYLPDLETFVTTSGSIRDASRVFAWLRELVNPLVDVRLEEDGPWARLVLAAPTDWNSLAKPYHSESMFASIVRFGRELLGDRGDFRRLYFRHPEPDYVDAYHAHFRMPLAFSQPRYELEFDRKLLDLPLQGAAPILHRQAEYMVRQRLARREQRRGVAARVASALANDEDLLSGDISATAEALGMSPRTLQRRLREAGTGFSELQSRARYRKAVELLRMPEMTVEAVADTLGFTDRRSFTRAFKRWCGRTPGSFHRNPDEV